MLVRLADRKLSSNRLVNHINPVLAAIMAGLNVFGCLDRRNYSYSSFFKNNYYKFWYL